MKLAAACFVLLVLLSAATRVAESSRPVAGGHHDVSTQRRHQHGHKHGGHHHHDGGDDNDDDDDDDSPPPPSSKKNRPQKLFVFGDDAADTGNGDDDVKLGARSSQWRPPFGMSDAAHAQRPSGRFSDGLVQSDYMAKIMGHAEAPPPYTYDNWADNGIDDAGLNFAVGGATVARDAQPGPSLGDQISQLRDLIRDGIVKRKDLRDSVALVAYSGNDYGYPKEDEDDDTMVAKVVDALADLVSGLQDLGMGKVLVNTLVSYGCEPWLTRKTTNYSSCDDTGNGMSDKHNTALRDRLADAEDVMVLDVNSVVRSLVEPKEGSTLGGKQLKERLRPCCEAADPDAGDYCGLDDAFYLCDHPEEYFFWDLAGHPTQAGWRAVMQLLQGPIMQFLGISNLEHL
ncbi:unnamed protein product [Urochloa decumbens]|uniref:SGNH hydrolase-type esterase domain-containing protein n=1 Tax=Urochloa decumbens TaxID=240449 RepID=A0ABC9HA65_9POAL